MSTVIAVVNTLVLHDDGQDLVEYGLLVALIAIFALFSVSLLGETINAVFWQPIVQNF